MLRPRATQSLAAVGATGARRIAGAEAMHHIRHLLVIGSGRGHTALEEGVFQQAQPTPEELAERAMQGCPMMGDANGQC